MGVSVRPNLVHPTRDTVVLTNPWTPDELATVAHANARPLAAKVRPGSEAHAKVLAAGGRVYQRCPPLRVDASTDGVAFWCEAHAMLPVESMDGLDVLELWTNWYETLHQDWSPTAPHQSLLALFGEIADGVDRHHSAVCSVDGQVVAAAFVFCDDQPPEAVTEALQPRHPRAREAVGSCLAHVLSGLTSLVQFDGHVGDPHFYPLWRTVPGVHAGPNDPVDLMEIPNGH